MSYPKWLYHKTESAKIVQDEKEQASLGKGWHESPAEFEQSPVDHSSDEPAEKPKRKHKKDSE